MSSSWLIVRPGSFSTTSFRRVFNSAGVSRRGLSSSSVWRFISADDTPHASHQSILKAGMACFLSPAIGSSNCLVKGKLGERCQPHFSELAHEGLQAKLVHAQEEDFRAVRHDEEGDGHSAEAYKRQRWTRSKAVGHLAIASPPVPCTSTLL